MSAETGRRVGATRSPTTRTSVITPVSFSQHSYLSAGQPPVVAAGYWGSHRGQSLFPTSSAYPAFFGPHWMMYCSPRMPTGSSSDVQAMGLVAAYQSSASSDQPRHHKHSKSMSVVGGDVIASTSGFRSTSAREVFAGCTLSTSSYRHNYHQSRHNPTLMTSFPGGDSTPCKRGSVCVAGTSVLCCPDAVGDASRGSADTVASSAVSVLSSTHSDDYGMAALEAFRRLSGSWRSCADDATSRLPSNNVINTRTQQQCDPTAGAGHQRSLASLSSPAASPSRPTDRYPIPRLGIKATTSARYQSPTKSGALAAAGARRRRRVSRFSRGSLIDLGGGRWKTVENLLQDDFVVGANRTGDTRIELMNVAHILHNHVRNTVIIGFQLQTHQTQTAVETTREHPFFVCNKGWSSCSPDKSGERYGLTCRQLVVGDCCVALSQVVPPRDAASQLVPPTLYSDEVLPQRPKSPVTDSQPDAPIDYSTATTSAPAFLYPPPVKEPSRPGVIQTTAPTTHDRKRQRAESVPSADEIAAGAAI